MIRSAGEWIRERPACAQSVACMVPHTRTPSRSSTATSHDPRPVVFVGIQPRSRYLRRVAKSSNHTGTWAVLESLGQPFEFLGFVITRLTVTRQMSTVHRRHNSLLAALVSLHLADVTSTDPDFKPASPRSRADDPPPEPRRPLASKHGNTSVDDYVRVYPMSPADDQRADYEDGSLGLIPGLVRRCRRREGCRGCREGCL